MNKDDKKYEIAVKNEFFTAIFFIISQEQGG